MSNWFHRNVPFLLLVGLTLLYIVAVLTNLGCLNLRVEEPRRVLISLEMLESGNYLQPHTLGWEYYNKPPVFNWLLAGFMGMSGSDSEFIARMPSFIFLLIWAVCQYFLMRPYLGRRTALLATFFMLTSADLFLYSLSNGAEIDIFYSLIVYLQAMSIFWFYERKKYLLLFISSWALCAVGFLTKGFPSLLFQGLTLAALAMHARSLRVIFRWQHFAGMAAFLILTGSYLWAYNKQSSATALLINLLNESLLKSTVGAESSGRLHRVFTYPLVLFRVLAPWCLFLLLLLRKEQRTQLWANPLVKFSVLFIIFNIGVYWSTAAQKTRYIFMFIPFAMAWIAWVYTQWEKKDPATADKSLKYAGIIFGLALVGLLVLPFFNPVPVWKIVTGFVMLALLLVFFFRYPAYRIWLFIAGLVLVRFCYAMIGLPLKKEKEFDYQKMIHAMVERTGHKDQVYFWGKTDSLNLDVVVAGKQVYRWKEKPVQVLPPRISYQVPYYFYRVTGRKVLFDTIVRSGRTYIAYRSHLKDRAMVEPLDSFYDKQFKDYLLLFRKRPGMHGN